MTLANRRAIVEVRFGPMAHRKAILAPGDTLRIGRTDRASPPRLVVPHDAQMSAEHLEIAWDGERCRVRDLGSAKGTWIQGERSHERDVESGAWIRAGDTSLMVYFEANTRPLRACPVPIEQAFSALEALRREPTGLFAVIDASRGPRPLQILRESVDEHRSLYDGVQGDALAHCAPYIVSFRDDSSLLERLVREGWGARWGIYMSSPRPIHEVRRHLRRFLIVEDDDTGKKAYFRYYDPAALRAFLPACTPRQREDFLGQIACFIAEGEEGEILRFAKE